eukprot:CAMPEP_0174948512 /NCGR_PEP_ID=MMETSP1355-20121228/89229_1 /TAXON_ID=464990 /ORGANISM="Hemiselmis tepida, Strain CCMP443" /LENGTH=345 /DNA_ID=CAMNT_0016196029 /DNA_START=6 /DNA_END=1040 /DNA_ORIENTATION=+
MTHYMATNHTVVVHASGLGLPLGPTERVESDSYMKSVHDIIPKEGRVPHSGNRTHPSLGSHWITMGAKDAFVAVNDSSYGPKNYHLLPPWTRYLMEKAMNKTFREQEEEEEDAEVASLRKVNASDIHGGCPGDPTGRTCLTGSDGVDGVHEWTAFSHGKSWNTRWLEKQGVNVGRWGIPGYKVHHWDRKPIDRPGKVAKEPDWAKMKTPQWSWENNAMRSQGWDPEGVRNRQLLLGAGYGANASLGGSIDDAYVNRTGYSAQFSVRQRYHPHDDHFADWKPNSTANVRLLYGSSAITNDLRWSIRRRAWVPEEFSWGDDHMSRREFEAALQPRGPRSGEPVSDFL